MEDHDDESMYVFWIPASGLSLPLRIERSDRSSSLSSSALEALKDFYADRDAREKQFEDLKAQAEDQADGNAVLSMDAFTEDWNASQFWVGGS